MTYEPYGRTDMHSCGCAVDEHGYIATECAEHSDLELPPPCPVCHDTGVVQCGELDGGGMYETACTERGCATPFPPVAADFTTGEAPF